MFDHRHYVPILKGREGEYGALSCVTPSLKGLLTPVIELPPIPWDFEEERPARTIDTHLEKVSQKIERAWGRGRVFFLDFLWVAESERMNDGTHPVRFVFDSARARGLSPIPVVSLIKDDEHLAACADSVAEDKRGVCIRLQREDFVEFADLRPELKRVLEAVGAEPRAADLLLDLRALTPDSRGLNAIDALALISRIPELKGWRTFTGSHILSGKSDRTPSLRQLLHSSRRVEPVERHSSRATEQIANFRRLRNFASRAV